ncbi:hypothetical protein EON66_06900 [archaeon]|nr:MAG: hypothetical protein EON66_06900 [archaeon]
MRVVVSMIVRTPTACLWNADAGAPVARCLPWATIADATFDNVQHSVTLHIVGLPAVGQSPSRVSETALLRVASAHEFELVRQRFIAMRPASTTLWDELASGGKVATSSTALVRC